MEDYIKDFNKYLKYEKNFSEHTIRAYLSDISTFLLWVEKEGDNVLKISNKKFTDFLRFIQNVKYEKSTIARKIASIRSFYNFLYLKEKISYNPIDNISSPKRSKSLPKFLTTEEVDSILQNIKIDSPSGYRNRLILELLWMTGMRISELSSLNFENLNLEGNEIKVIGKGNKERIVLIPDKTKDFLNNYIQNVRPLISQNCPNGSDAPLFINNNGYRLQNQTVRKVIKEVVDKIKLPKNVTPHVFRHSFATKMLENGADLRIVQELLGHASIANTQIYTHVSTQRMQEVYKEAHPRS